MKSTLQPISYLGLALTFLPCLFLFAGVIEAYTSKWIMVVGMLVWFGTAIFWIKPTAFDDPEES